MTNAPGFLDLCLRREGSPVAKSTSNTADTFADRSQHPPVCLGLYEAQDVVPDGALELITNAVPLIQQRSNLQ